MSHTYHRYKAGDEPVAGYRLTDHLGAGGFGEVWKANAPGGTEVALKIIDLTGQQGVQEFASLRVVKKVRHPNLISLQAFWMKDADGQIVDETGDSLRNTLEVSAPAADPKRQTQTNIAMTANFARPVELLIAMQLGSMSLHRRLEECREQGMAGVPVAELLEYLEQAARGIDFLNKPIHDLGKGPLPIVHGDVKPHNILVVGDAAVVCDFGLARAVETLRKTSMAPVTVAYAAPESFKGKVTPTSDQYSLAITYVELRTGRLPFDETMTPYQVMEAHVMRSLDFSRLPEPERVVVQRATESKPEERWPSSRDMILALRHAVAQTGELPLRPGEGPYLGGPTPSHSLTARPRPQDTGMPTRIGVDPHKDTMHPGGRTPALGLSHQTEPSPAGFGRPGDSLAETAMLGAGALVPAAKSKKKSAILIGAVAAVAAVLGLVFGPKLLRNNTTAGLVRPVDSGEPESSDPNVQYIRLVQSKINGDEFEAAIKLLDKAPKELPKFEKDDLQNRLHAKYISAVDSRVQNGSFPRALGDLEDAPSGVGLTEEDRKQAREKIRAGWLSQAQDELQNDNFKSAKETAGGLLKRFDGDRDAQFVVARADVRSSDYAGALAVLEQLGKTADLPKEYQPLDAGLALLATGLNTATPADPVKQLDGLLQLGELEKNASPPPGLAISGWERNRLEGLRKDVAASVEKLLRTLPPDQAKPLAAKLEMLGASAGLEMFKVKTAIAGKQFDEARKALKASIDKLPADADSARMEAAAMGLVIDLRDPATKPADVSAALADALKRVDKLSPAMRGELCATAEALALGSPAAMLEPGLALVSRAHELDPGDKGTSQQFARLLAKRLELRAAQPAMPSREELAKLAQDCETVEAAKLDNPTIEALHAECLILQDSRDRQRIVALVEKAEPADGYVKFVQARMQRLSPQPDWARIGQLLTEVYGGDPAALSPAVVAPFRREVAAKLLTDAALKKRAAVNASDASTALENPFGKDKKNADEAFKLLDLAARVGVGTSVKNGGTLEPFKMVDLATAISKDEESGVKDAGQRDRWMNLTLAAGSKTQPDDKLTRSLVPALTKLTDAELGNDAIPFLLVAFQAEKGSAADQPAAVKAAQRVIENFQQRYRVADTQAVALYKDVIDPALALAGTLGKAKTPPADLDKFYAAAADFIGHYQRGNWPFADKQVEIEKLAGKAIELNSKVPKYYTSRGLARVSQIPPNVEGALKDAEDATKLDANFPAGYALQGHALIYRSRQQPTAGAHAADLDAAIAKCQAAVDKGKQTDEKHAMHLLYLSMALLEKANLLTDPKQRKEFLEQAVEQAQKAVDLEKEYPHYAYTAMGNALEDVAWLVDDEAQQKEKNYQAAINAFSQANLSDPNSVDPLIGRARCFYKALSDSHLDPKFLNLTAAEAMEAAISDLQKALELQGDSPEPNMWIGKAYQQLGKFAEADAALGTAVKLAEDKKQDVRATYLSAWARNALSNPALVGDEKTKVVRERSEKLKTAPSLGGYSTAKEASLLVGQSLISEKPPKIAEAIKEYDAALADYDKADPKKPLDPTKADGWDANLLMARAACRCGTPLTEWNQTAYDNVVKDISRILQLKPSPRDQALAYWYAAQAKTLSGSSISPTFTQNKVDRGKGYLVASVDDYRKAIELAPNDPDSWQWKALGAKMLAYSVNVAPATTTPEQLKKWAAEARKWADESVDQVSNRPDLADRFAFVQRIQKEVETTLTAKNLPR